MQNYFFTFGLNHFNISGDCLADFWVRVVAEDFNQARHIFLEVFASQYLPALDKWSFQYSENDFDQSYFPGGEYMLFNQLF